jgi:hypothetical protein
MWCVYLFNVPQLSVCGQVLTGVATLHDARGKELQAQPQHYIASLGDIAAMHGGE